MSRRVAAGVSITTLVAGIILTVGYLFRGDVCSVSLHGYFGKASNLKEVKSLLLDAGDTSLPLPPCWERGVPTENYTGPHKLLFIDKDRGGKDTLETYGLETSTLAFYVGEGSPNQWRASSNFVPLDRVKAGDGLLRYLWLYSCNVLAHGPKVNSDYPLPQAFKPGGTSQEDVFHRWTKSQSFGPHLRMICGGSTRLGFAGIPAIWNHLFEEKRALADAFILGASYPSQVPACLARGGPNPKSSALTDRTLLTDGFKPDDSNWLHFQYAVNCKAVGDGSRVSCGETSTASNEPRTLKVLSLPRLATEALPPPIQPDGGSEPLGFLPLPRRGPFIREFEYNRDSGAVVIIKIRPQYTLLTQCNEVKIWDLSRYMNLAEAISPQPNFVPTVGGSVRLSRQATALEMRVESRQIDALLGVRKCWRHGLFVRIENKIKIDDQTELPVFGSAMTLQIPQPGEPQIASLSTPRRKLNVEGPPHKIQEAETAISKAHQELHLDPETYPERAAKAILGYEEAPLRCKQEFLRPTYEILFPPNRPDYPTVIVRRDARDSTDKSGSSWECREWND
jgi:hypothetical protein